jgi:hypothetical protein
MGTISDNQLAAQAVIGGVPRGRPCMRAFARLWVRDRTLSFHIRSSNTGETHEPV